MSSTSTRDGLSNAERRHVVRWLLRPLGEPAFLRLYLEKEFEREVPLALFEATFWGLEGNSEHLPEHRKLAWKTLKEWLPGSVEKATEWFRLLVQRLGAIDANIGGQSVVDDVWDLSKHWALPELFTQVSPPSFELSGYYELHCHLRGAVPFSYLWRQFLLNERIRANLRKKEDRCAVGDWSKTWAELCAQAASYLSVELDSETSLLDMSHHLRDMSQRIRESTTPCDHEIRYLAICTGLRRHLLHQRGEVGLSSFVSSYDRYSRIQKSRGISEGWATRNAVCAILDQFRKHGCVAIELRPTLESTAAELQRKMRDVILGYFEHVRRSTKANVEPLALGLVPSLFKQELIKKHHSDGDADPNLWEAQANRWSHQVELLLNAIDESPVMRHFVVGLDAAGKELGCPPRTLGRAFARVRERTAQHGLARVRAGRVVSLDWLKRLVAEDDSLKSVWDKLEASYVPHARLGLTVHAGEDFADPLTGLRHIWESVHALDLWEGDRIGHAIAASLNPQRLHELLERRASKTLGAPIEEITVGGQTIFRTRKPRGTHLLDLAWTYDIAQSEHDRHAAGTLLMQAMGETSRHVVDTDRTARLLLDEHQTAWPFFPGVRYFDPKQVHPEHWTWVCYDSETKSFFEKLRQRVVDMLRRRGIVIESCPTSNLAVANLQAPPLQSLMAEGLRCVVATDDPGLFDAWPRDEFQRALPSNPEQRQRLLQEATRSSFVRFAAS